MPRLDCVALYYMRYYLQKYLQVPPHNRTVGGGHLPRRRGLLHRPQHLAAAAHHPLRPPLGATLPGLEARQQFLGGGADCKVNTNETSHYGDIIENISLSIKRNGQVPTFQVINKK